MPKIINLSLVTEKNVLHWGEMGTRGGASRTVAQIHALLYLSERVPHAEEISETRAGRGAKGIRTAVSFRIFLRLWPQCCLSLPCGRGE